MNNATEIRAEPDKQEFFVIRQFDAPREDVFDFFADPALIVQWFLPRELEMRVDFMNCQSGGSYHHVHKGNGGLQFGFFGVFHEVVAPERIVKTSEFEGLPERGHVTLEIITFETVSSERTRVAIQSICRSAAHRDGMLGAGFEPIVARAHKQLDDLLMHRRSTPDRV
jgi:uncharacterized protein YndB with AHSA1/START domain